MTIASSVQFLGAARCVTGSKYLLRTSGGITLIDCGLFQGLKQLRLRNWEPLPIAAKEIDQVILTHGHIDHTGYLPRLCKDGFNGPIFCTPSTAELLALLLPDCGHLQEEDARYASKKGFSKHAVPLPLFTSEDGEKVLPLLRTIDFGAQGGSGAGLTFNYHPTGHLLGAASVEIGIGETRLWFSGDLGRYQDDVMSAPEPAREADYVFVESTYGNRLHPTTDMKTELAAIINRTAERGGCVVIPAFAIGRTQTVLYQIRRLEDANLIPKLPVYIDSPMAVDASALYCKYGNEPNLRIDLTMGPGDCCPLRCNEAHFVKSAEESKKLNQLNTPGIIISASGMATGGRVVHHLARRLPDRKNTVLLVGYQAEGTRGRLLLDGVNEIKMHGQFVPVRAEIACISGLSAHGDQSDLMRWLATFRSSPQKTFLVHGEGEGLTGLQKQIEERFKWATHIPDYMETFEWGR